MEVGMFGYLVVEVAADREDFAEQAAEVAGEVGEVG